MAAIDTLTHQASLSTNFLQHNRPHAALASPDPARRLVHHERTYSDDSATSDPLLHSGTSTLSKGGNATSQPIRRRISRACDQCNQLRTKCDGKSPCAHCVEFGLTCEYARVRKKRGKASKKDLAEQQAASAGSEDHRNGSINSNSSDDNRTRTTSTRAQPVLKRKRNQAEFEQADQIRRAPSPPINIAQQQTLPGLGQIGESITGHVAGDNSVGLPTSREPHPSSQMAAYESLDDYHRGMLLPAPQGGHNTRQHGSHAPVYPPMAQGSPAPNFHAGPYSVPSPNSQKSIARQYYEFGQSPIPANFMEQSSQAGTPGWMNLPSPNTLLGYNYLQPVSSIESIGLRYPVLQPLVGFLHEIMPISLACDLLEDYFATTSTTMLHPRSPYVLGLVFRKQSFLRQTSPRICNPALLASMIWIAAQTSDAGFFQSPPSTRGKVCQKLYNLTTGLLKPLVHEPADGTQLVNNFVDGMAPGGFGIAFNGQPRELGGGSPGATAGLDDIATYMHIATVASASEYKAASMRWWNAAWSVARELKLGRELPANPPQSRHGSDFESDGGDAPRGSYSEEEREERRRLWWLLYSVDRHLALCYNRPLFLLDAECDSLLQPEDDLSWQAGDFYAGPSHDHSARFRRPGPAFECSGHSIFGYMLPIMTILGHIVELNQKRNHPHFGMSFANSVEWANQVADISNELDAYGRSLEAFKERWMALANSTANRAETGASELKDPLAHSMDTDVAYDTILRTNIVVAYSTHLIHTMYILLNSKWDPISLLDNNDSWISTDSFVHASQHAVVAARAIDNILKYDSAIEQMPWFWGIYLLQASFLLLLIADKLQANVKADEVKACETIVRAHEACMVTLNTEYQKNFRNVMNSALAQVRRIKPPDSREQSKRKELLALYRWTPDGTGLAL